jgi:hypothetical protein
MKLLLVGDYRAYILEPSYFDAFCELEVEVFPFKILDYFPLVDKKPKITNFYSYFSSKIQNKFCFGSIISKINSDLVKTAERLKPDAVFFFRLDKIYPESVKTISHFAKVLVHCVDDPFSEKYPFYFWRHYRNSLPYFHHIFYHRHKNENDLKNRGFTNISLLRIGYTKYLFPINELNKRKYLYDVVFIGHFENDGRDIKILNLLRNGIKVKIFGPEWNRSKYYKELINYQGKITSVRDELYNDALNKSKIALVFLSKLNNDTYAGRNFEIPATKTFMLSEYTDDLASLFEEDKEIVFFRNENDLMQKINYYLDNETERNKIAEASYKRIMKDGHDVISRAKYILSCINKLKS